MKKLAILVLLLILVPVPMSAQSSKPDCKPGDVIATANALKATGDNAKDMDALIKLSQDISAANIACGGFRFSGSKPKILGPIDLPKGLFMVSLKTDGWGSAEGKVLDGQCGNEGDSVTAFGLNWLNATTPGLIAEYLASKGCKMTIEISLVTTPWELTIEPVK